jgi:AAA domain
MVMALKKKALKLKGTATMESVGFVEYIEEEPKPRMIVATMSQEKRGKTHFAMTAPGPIAYINIDKGEEGVLNKFKKKGKRILYKEIPKPKRGLKGDAAKAAYTEAFEEIKEALEVAIDNPSIKTVVVDTATELWEYLRLARHGKLTQIMPHQYTDINAEFRELIRTLFDSNKNAILIHKVKKEYKEGKDGKANFTGRYEFAGFSEMRFLAQVVVEHRRYENEEGPGVTFGIKVLDSRLEPDCIGLELDGPSCNFTDLAISHFPDIDPSEWEDR